MMWFFVSIAVLLGAMGFVYWRWRRQIALEIAEGTAIEWAHLEKNEPEFLEGMTREKFDGIYARVHTPRLPGYALAAIVTFVAALPVIFVLLTAVLWGADKAGMLPEPAEVADRLLLDGDEVRFFKAAPPEAALYYVEDVAGFYYFFGVLIVWLAIVAFYTRRFHARRPGYLRDEIIRTR